MNNEALAFAAIRGGAGLGYVLEDEVTDDVTDDVAAGRLVSVLGRWCSSFLGGYLNYPSRQVTPALRALIEMLR